MFAVVSMHVFTRTFIYYLHYLRIAKFALIQNYLKHVFVSLNDFKILFIIIAQIYVFGKIETDSCSGSAFYCVADRQCVNSWNRCDYVKNCQSGEDEAGCGKENLFLAESSFLY